MGGAKYHRTFFTTKNTKHPKGIPHTQSGLTTEYTEYTEKKFNLTAVGFFLCVLCIPWWLPLLFL